MTNDRQIAPQRSRQRRTAELRCQLMADSFEGSAPHETKDLSAGGVFIESELPLNVGERVVVAITPPGLTYPLYLKGQIRRVRLARRKTDAFPSGMAIAFEGVSPLDARLLERSLAGLPLPAVGVRRAEVEAVSPSSPEGLLARIVAGLRARRSEALKAAPAPAQGAERRVQA